MKKLFWLFLFLYSCSPENGEPKQSGFSDTDSLNVETNQSFDLRRVIASTDPRKPDALSNVVLAYRVNTPIHSPRHCDEDLALIKSFAIDVARNLNAGGFLDTMINSSGKIEEMNERKLNRLGFRVNYVEGEPYLASNPEYLLSNMRPCLSGSMIVFLEEFDIESKNTAITGEQLEIKIDELLRRLIFWENFMNDHPNFILADEARTTYHFYLSLYMTGTGKSRAFDEKSLLFNSEYRKSYEGFIQNHPQSPTAKFIDAYYTVLRENNFYYSEEVNRYYESVRSPYYGK